MDIAQNASDLLKKGQRAVTDTAERAKAALDVDGDGRVEFEEVVNAAAGRVVETKDAVVEAVSHVREGFDANGDGKVSLDEVEDVAEALGERIEDKAEAVGDKIEAKFDELAGKAKNRLG